MATRAEKGIDYCEECDDSMRGISIPFIYWCRRCGSIRINRSDAMDMVFKPRMLRQWKRGQRAKQVMDVFRKDEEMKRDARIHVGLLCSTFCVGLLAIAMSGNAASNWNMQAWNATAPIATFSPVPPQAGAAPQASPGCAGQAATYEAPMMTRQRVVYEPRVIEEHVPMANAGCAGMPFQSLSASPRLRFIDVLGALADRREMRVQNRRARLISHILRNRIGSRGYCVNCN